MSSQTVAVPAALHRATGWLVAARARVLALHAAYVLSGLVAVQWIAVAALAATVRHNGWVYYMGGDQLWHYTSGYLLVHGKIAPTLVGYGWATILAPIAALAGPNLVSALPAVVLLCTVVLLPLSTLCMYGIGARLGGRLFGYWVALLWVLIPYLGIPYALHGYHQKYTELTLPQILGLGAMADFPSVVALVVGAYLCLRALDERSLWWSASAGFAVGYSLGIKPSNAAFLFAPVVVFLVVRWRALAAFAGGLVPPLIVLAYWKERGYGNLPAFAHAQPVRRVALGAGGIFKPLHKYTGSNSWTQLYNNLIQLREHLWSDRILEALVVAGIVALVLRHRRGGVLAAIWFTAFLLLKGTYLNSSVKDATFWRLLLPAFPAFVLLVASVPLLLPGVRLRPPPPRPLRLSRRTRLGALGALAVVFFLFPLALIAAASPVHQSDLAAIQFEATLVPVSKSLTTSTTLEPNGVLLQWPATRTTSGATFYRVFRTGASTTVSDAACRVVPNAPDSCILQPSAQSIGATRQEAWLDRPPPGTWAYRIGLSANWLNDETQGDVYVFGPVAQITVPRRG